MESRLSNSKGSFVASAAYSLLSIAAPLSFAVIATPYLVQNLGAKAYGYYSLVLAIIGFGFTTGIGRVAAKYVPENRSAGRSEELGRLLRTTLLITSVVAVLEALILALSSTVLVSTILNVPENATDELHFAIYIACLIGPAMMLSQVFQSAVQGIHRFLTFAALTIGASFVLNLGSVILVVRKVAYGKLFILNLAVTALVALAFFLVARRSIPELTTGIYDRASIRKVGGFAASIFVYQSITSVFYLFERSYILRNFGAEALTYYTVPFMFGLYLHGLIFSFSQAAIPRLNEKVEREDGLIKIYETVTKIAVVIAVFIALMFFFLGEMFLTLWMGPEFAARAYELMILHGAAFATIAVSIGCWILTEATHRPGINAVSSVTTVVIGIISMIFLGQTFGTEGIAAGRIIGAATVIPLIFVVEKTVFRKVLVRFWAAMIGRLAIASAGIFGAYYLLLTDTNYSWPMFIISGLVLTGAFCIPLFLSGYFRPSDLKAPFLDPPEILEI